MTGRQLVISITPAELEEINADLELLGIENKYRSDFLKEAIRDVISIRKEGKISFVLTESAVVEIAKVANKLTKQIEKDKRTARLAKFDEALADMKAGNYTESIDEE